MIRVPAEAERNIKSVVDEICDFPPAERNIRSAVAGTSDFPPVLIKTKNFSLPL